jgi:RNA polymerase sigma-70 factor (ECF subfamily)
VISTENWRVQANTPGADDHGADDIDLLHRAADGDEAAFHRLVDRHAQSLYRLAYSLIGNAADAEDVLQETFVGAFRGLGGFEARASVKTWLTRILLTQTAKWRRQRRRHPVEPIGENQPAGAAKPAAAVDHVDQRIDVHAALLQLTPEHREILVLREFEHLAYDQIAQVLGVPRGTVESRLHRARLELRGKLPAYLPGNQS